MDNQEQKISNFKKFGMKGNAKAIRQMYKYFTKEKRQCYGKWNELYFRRLYTWKKTIR